MKRVLLVGSQHGDERLGDLLFARIRNYHPDLLPHITYVLANPRAHRLRQRFTESDMNRSYGTSPDTYEGRQAVKLLNAIRATHYDLILDLHTTAAVMEPCYIAPPELSEEVKEFIKVGVIDKVVIMQHEIVATSLVGNAPRAVSIEIPVYLLAAPFLEQLVTALQHFVKGSIPAGTTKEFFYVDSLIDHSSYSAAQFARMENFALFENRFYSVLVGSHSYKKYTAYRGFAAPHKVTKRL